MKTVSAEQLVDAYQELAQRLLGKPTLPTVDVIGEFTDFYQQYKIEDAGDSLLIEWGLATLPKLDGFQDTRSRRPTRFTPTLPFVSLQYQTFGPDGDEAPVLSLVMGFNVQRYRQFAEARDELDQLHELTIDRMPTEAEQARQGELHDIWRQAQFDGDTFFNRFDSSDEISRTLTGEKFVSDFLDVVPDEMSAYVTSLG